MPLTNKSLIALCAAAALFGCALLVSTFASFAGASAPAGLEAGVATSSRATVTTTASLVLATSTCTSRIVSTTVSPIMLSFSDINGFVPSGFVGHVQAASTTVAYDSGIYGCKAMRVYSFVTQDITVTETR